MEDISNLDSLTLIDKEAMCYRLLVARDKINEQLRIVQDHIKKNDG